MVRMNGSLSDHSIKYNRKSIAARPFPRPAFPRAHLDTTAGRGGPKSEIRNPKPETNSNAQWSKAKYRQQGSGLGHSLLGAWGLFRTSSFGFRVSALWMAVVPRCTLGCPIVAAGVPPPHERGVLPPSGATLVSELR